MQVAPWVRITGPLVPYFDGFRAELAAHGYTELSAANQLRVMADLSRWLDKTSQAVEQVNREVVGRFLAKRRRTHTQFNSERGIKPLFRYLEDIEIVVLEPMPERRPRREVLRAYERYLVEERGVMPARQAAYLTMAEDLLRGRRSSTLTAAAITRAIDAEACDLHCEDVVLSTGAHVRCRGKGRKERCTPLTRSTVAVMRAWLRLRRGLPAEPAFPSRRGTKLSRDAVERLVPSTPRMRARPAAPFAGNASHRMSSGTPLR